MNKIAHGIVLVFLGMACGLIWSLLQLPRMVQLRGMDLQLPAFTRFCTAVGSPVLLGLSALGTAYCIWVWLGKAGTRPSWVGFFATAAGSLFLVSLPVITAIYLPLVSALGHLATK